MRSDLETADRRLRGTRPHVLLPGGCGVETRLNVPNDVTLIGANNETAFNENITPTLSSIDLGHERIG